MKLLTFIFAALFFASCTHKSQSTNVSLADYFTYGGMVEAAGVKMIPIHTRLGILKYGQSVLAIIPK